MTAGPARIRDAPCAAVPQSPSNLLDLVGMRSRGLWMIIGFFAVALIIVAVAMSQTTVQLVVALAAAGILTIAGVMLVMIHDDPLPVWATTLVAVTGPVASAMVLAVSAYPVGSMMVSWVHGAGTAVCFFLSVRGRRVAPWLGFAGMVVVYGIAAVVVDGRSFLYGAGLLAPDAAPLIMGIFLAHTIRPTAASVFSLREKATARIADASAEEAAADERGKQLHDLDQLARPMLVRIAEGGDLTDAERFECALLEAHLRDRLRAPILATSEVEEAAYAARSRGVEVVFLDDGGLGDLGPDVPELVTAIRGVATDALAAATSGRVCVRVLPPGRKIVASVLSEDDGGSVRLEISGEGLVHRTISFG